MRAPRERLVRKSRWVQGVTSLTRGEIGNTNIADVLCSTHHGSRSYNPGVRCCVHPLNGCCGLGERHQLRVNVHIVIVEGRVVRASLSVLVRSKRVLGQLGLVLYLCLEGCNKQTAMSIVM